MPSLNYEEIYSKFRLKAEAYDILQYREDDVSAVFMPEYLHASINKPYIRRLFSELKLGDTVQELTYIMKYSVDDDFDAEFITDILGIGNALKTIITRTTKVGKMPQYADEVDNATLSNASASLHAIGVDVYNPDGSDRGIITVMSELKDKWDDLTDAQQAKIAFDVAA